MENESVDVKKREKQIKLIQARRSPQLIQKQQLQVCWNTRLETIENDGLKMFPCWFCNDVNCCRKNISKRARNTNSFTVPTLNDS